MNICTNYMHATTVPYTASSSHLLYSTEFDEGNVLSQAQPLTCDSNNSDSTRKYRHFYRNKHTTKD